MRVAAAGGVSCEYGIVTTYWNEHRQTTLVSRVSGIDLGGPTRALLGVRTTVPHRRKGQSGVNGLSRE